MFGMHLRCREIISQNWQRSDAVQDSDLSSNLRKASFTDRKDTIDRFVAVVEVEITRRPVNRVLDLGCGTGAVSLAVADKFPKTEIVGIDISPVNVTEAISRLVETGFGDRVSFEAADFLNWDGGQFDLIVSDSVLHLISCDDNFLASKIGTHLSPGGRLLATMPVSGARNGLLIAARSVWWATPRQFDELAMSLARRMHPDEDVEVLRDRIGYLRILPERQYGKRFLAAMANAGLNPAGVEDWLSPSVLKLQHGLISLAKGE